MKISEITVFSYNANYAFGTYSMSGRHVATGQPSLFLRIRTDDGKSSRVRLALDGSLNHIVVKS